MNLSGRAMLLGAFDQVEELLTAADALVHPGCQEGASMAVAEAMGAAIPAIVADWPGHRLLVEHEHTGLVVPPGDVEALSAALTRIFDDLPLADRLGRAAQARAAEQFSLAEMVDRHVTLFESLIANR
jgi:glycosyltransferase involved in cell wall biosynthesis